MTKTYAENKAAALVRDHNTYLYRNNAEAAADYKTALDILAQAASKQGIEIAYKTDSNGYITID